MRKSNKPKQENSKIILIAFPFVVIFILVFAFINNNQPISNRLVTNSFLNKIKDNHFKNLPIKSMITEYEESGYGKCKNENFTLYNNKVKIKLSSEECLEEAGDWGKPYYISKETNNKVLFFIKSNSIWNEVVFESSLHKVLDENQINDLYRIKNNISKLRRKIKQERH